MNIFITPDNFFTATTDDDSNWETLKFPLPEGNWSIHNINYKKVTLIQELKKEDNDILLSARHGRIAYEKAKILNAEEFVE